MRCHQECGTLRVVQGNYLHRDELQCKWSITLTCPRPSLVVTVTWWRAVWRTGNQQTFHPFQTLCSHWPTGARPPGTRRLASPCATQSLGPGCNAKGHPALFIDIAAESEFECSRSLHSHQKLIRTCYHNYRFFLTSVGYNTISGQRQKN